MEFKPLKILKCNFLPVTFTERSLVAVTRCTIYYGYLTSFLREEREIVYGFGVNWSLNETFRECDPKWHFLYQYSID